MMILLAQDHSPSTDELTRTLETLGHTVHSATNDEAAWQVVKGGQARLVITDWTTSGIDAPRLCRRIRSQSGRPYTYIIVMTNRGESADRLECLHAGADDFLTKPADARELAARLEIARRILSMQEELEQKNERLAELVTIDALTGLKNRRHFREVLDAAYSMAVRHQQPLSVVMLDVDDFKRYNDSFGHPAGDEVLCVVADLLRDGARQNDVVARFGGEEFAILLPATDVPGSLAFAERLRAAITELPLASRARHGQPRRRDDHPRDPGRPGTRRGGRPGTLSSEANGSKSRVAPARTVSRRSRAPVAPPSTPAIRFRSGGRCRVAWTEQQANFGAS